MSSERVKEFRVCPECQYQRGFHVFFKNPKGKTKIGLICPQCGYSYDIGWITTGIKSLKHKKGLAY
jgi:rubredoxin